MSTEDFFLSIHMQKNKSVPHSLRGVLWKGTYCLHLPGLFAMCAVHDSQFLRHIEGFILLSTFLRPDF